MNRKLLFLDTETAGLPKKWNLPATDTDNWPKIVQIAWLVYDEYENEILTKSYIIKPAGDIIPKASVKIHGITTEYASKNGFDREEVITEIYNDIKTYNPVLIAHCMEFDENILGASFQRTGLPNILPECEKFCTMNASRDFCQLPNQKSPRLDLLYRKLFHCQLENMHDALVDAKATAKCFFELKKRKVIKVNEDTGQLEIIPEVTRQHNKGCIGTTIMFVIALILTLNLFI